MSGEFRSLPAAFSQQAQSHPAEPWLFFPVGWRRRWFSRGAFEAWVRHWSAILMELPAGTEVVYPTPVEPAIVALDLAIQRAGLVAFPSPESPTHGVVAQSAADVAGDWLVRDGERSWRLPYPRQEQAGSSAPERPESAGAVVVTGEGLRHVRGADLIAIAAAWQAGSERPAERPIVVLSTAPVDPLSRALWSWVVLNGAAVMLEPYPDQLVETALWARPTLFVGTPAEIAVLGAAFSAQEERLGRRLGRLLRPGRAPRLQRLAQIVVREGPLAAENVRSWEERGVQVRREAEVLAGWPMV